MNNSTYMRLPKTLYDTEKDGLEASGFENKGEVRLSLDETQVILEEDMSAYPSSLLNHADTDIYNHADMKAYLEANSADWDEDDGN